MKDKNLFLLILLASCWGPSFLFIKLAVIEIPPLLLAALRIGIGAVALNAFLLIKKERLPKDLTFWKDVLIAGFFVQGLPFALINWGEQYVDSTIAALLNGLTPLSTILLAYLILNEHLSTRKISGILLGLAGLLLLVWPDLKAGATSSLYGILAITVASVSYGVGLVYVRKKLMKARPVHAPAAQLLTVTIYLLPIGLLTSPEFSWAEISWLAIGSVLALGFFGTAIAFIIYYKLLDRTSASYVSMVTFLMPIYGVILGIVFLGEGFNSWMLFGSLAILGGIAVVNKQKSSTKVFGSRLDHAYFSKFR